MSDAIWEIVADQNTFNSLLIPVNWNQANIVEIVRWEQELRLETLAHRPMLGKNRHRHQPDWSKKRSLYLVNRFIPRMGFLDQLFDTLRLFRIPVVWQVSLSPTVLGEDEEQALLEETARCEKYLNETFSATGKPRSHWRRAAQVLDNLAEQLVTLEDEPFMVSISVASEQPLPDSLLESMGVEITLLVKMGKDGCAGGYDILSPADAGERQRALDNMLALGAAVWSVRPNLMDVSQAATAFRLPFAPKRGLPGIPCRLSLNRPLSHAMAVLAWDKMRKQKLFLGNNNYYGSNTVRQ
jgi:hypothetical protein